MISQIAYIVNYCAPGGLPVAGVDSSLLREVDKRLIHCIIIPGKADSVSASF